MSKPECTRGHPGKNLSKIIPCPWCKVDDQGVEIGQLKARAEKAEADKAFLRVALDGCMGHKGELLARAEKAEADRDQLKVEAAIDRAAREATDRLVAAQRDRLAGEIRDLKAEVARLQAALENVARVPAGGGGSHSVGWAFDRGSRPRGARGGGAWVTSR